MTEDEFRILVERTVSTACSEYANGLIRGPVNTRAQRRYDAVVNGTEAIMDLVKAKSQ